MIHAKYREFLQTNSIHLPLAEFEKLSELQTKTSLFLSLGNVQQTKSKGQNNLSIPLLQQLPLKF